MGYDCPSPHPVCVGVFSMCRLGLALCLFASASAFGQERQYRALELADGRRLNAEILATEPTGLRMRIPQGETLISFELLVNISPIDSASFDDQPPTRVWVHSPERLEEVAAVYAALPNTVVSTRAATNGLSPGLAYSLTECGPDFTCMAEALDGEDWMWLVTVLPPPDDSDAALVWRGRASGGPPITRVDQKLATAETFWRDGHAALGLIANTNAPKALREAFKVDGVVPPSIKELKPRNTKPRNMVLGSLAGAAVMGGGTFAVGLLGDAAARPDGGAYIGNTVGMGVVGLLIGGAVGHSTGKTVLPEVAWSADGARGGVAVRW
jgi:hypothetical protein